MIFKAQQALTKALKPKIRALLNLFWPPVCALCPEQLPLANSLNSGLAAHLCPDCLDTLELMPDSICLVCGRPFWDGGPSHVCGDCLSLTPIFKTARAAAVYNGGLSKSITLLKYHGGLNQLAFLADLAGPFISPPAFSGDFDLIVPMPISPKRLRQRGYNQAHELAKIIYRPWRPLLDNRCLLRPRDGDLHQAGLSGKERRQAIRGCFEVSSRTKVQGARVLLFDDVLTTGATANEAAKTLLKAGAIQVDLATVARTLLKSWDLAKPNQTTAP